jgi:hypothetical protein
MFIFILNMPHVRSCHYMHDGFRDEKKVGHNCGRHLRGDICVMTLYTRWIKESGIANMQKLLNATKRCVIAIGQAASYQANRTAMHVRQGFRHV